MFWKNHFRKSCRNILPKKCIGFNGEIDSENLHEKLIGKIVGIFFLESAYNLVQGNERNDFMYNCTLKEVKENGKTKFIIEVICEEQEKKVEVIKEIHYVSKHHGNSKAIIGKSKATGVAIRFESIKQASEMIKTGAKSHTIEKHIGECLKGIKKSAYGYTWEYTD